MSSWQPVCNVMGYLLLVKIFLDDSPISLLNVVPRFLQHSVAETSA